MAGEMASFFIRLGTIFDDKGFKDAASGVKNVESKVLSLSDGIGKLGALVGAGSAIYGLVTFANKSLDAFAKQELAERKLEQAMRNLGVYTKAAAAEQVAFASALQATTKYGDEDILSIQALLTTFGLYGSKLKETTKATLDLASGMGIDLRSAALLLGKAAVGETASLSRYGIIISESIPKAQRFAEVLRLVSDRFGGSAVAELDTYSGKIKNLANQWDDLGEQLGGFLVGPATGVVSWLKTGIGYLENFAAAIRFAFPSGEVGQLTNELRSTERELLAIKKSGDAVYNVMLKAMGSSVQEEVVRLENKIILLRRQLQGAREDAAKDVVPPGPRAIVDPAVEAERVKRMEAARTAMEEQAGSDEAMANQRIQSATMTQEQIDSIGVQGLARRLNAEGQHAKATELLDATTAKNRKKVQVDAINGWTAALSNLTALSNAKNKEIAIIGRLASAAMAIIYAHLGAAHALAFVPPPFNFAMAKLVLAAGYANAAMIMGVPLAKGGIVRAAMGGTLAQVGEAGQDEAVLPLDGSTMRRLAMAITGASGGRMAVAGGHGNIQISQVFHMAGSGGGKESGGNIFDEIRTATRDGVVEALDMAKQVYRTGVDLENEA